MSSRSLRWFATWLVPAVLAISPGLGNRPLQASTPESGWVGFNISGGRLYIDEALILKSFSIFKTNAAFLFFYVPGDGLWIVAPRDFSGAVEGGSFDKDRLAVDLDGRSLRIESKKPILGAVPTAAWVRHDPDFSLDTGAPMFGYGDSETDANAWQDNFDAH